ncbi:hypothetical protein [Brevibacterium sediminis]|uniref:hypothetical protein n=1 Tax=Brevibacterium sediminis TaxID=1857024 RepID=UPI00366BF6EA
MSDTVKSWIEERRAIIHGAREAIRPAEAIDLGLIDLPRALDALNAVLELHHGERDEYGCWTCRFCSHIQQTKILHPCATVRAIEGAINGERG